MVAVDGKILNFRPIPEEAEDLILHFYAKPKELSAGDSFPDYIPAILQKEIFQNYALKEAYLQIEDGIDGVTPNTQKYGGLAASGHGLPGRFLPECAQSETRSETEFGVVLMKPLTIRGFKGMNNVLEEGGFSGHDDGTMTAIPKVILNADVTAEERLKKRGGYRLLTSLPNAHSAWATRTVMLAAAEGRLYRFYPDGSKVNLCALSGPYEEKLFYAAVDDRVYISSRHWMGILNPERNR